MTQESSAAPASAHEVVGLYGDPDTTWGICLELGVEQPVEVDALSARMDELLAAHPHLGPGWVLEQPSTSGWEAARERAAAAPYEIGGPLVRVLVGDCRVLVAVHHGTCDGLGLLAVAGQACGLALISHARGIGDRPAPSSFLRSSVRRLVEALLRPPPRFAAHEPATGSGEHLLVRTVPRQPAGSVDLALAVARVFTSWNTGHRRNHRPLMVAGASRREQGTLAPDRQTAYLRFRVEPGWDRAQARAAFAAVAPEPDFPETSARGIGPRITHLLRGRLGGTAQLSNLGAVEAPGLAYAAMFPALSGPRAFAVGLVSTETATTVSLRTRGTEFSADDTAQLLDLVVDALARA